MNNKKTRTAFLAMIALTFCSVKVSAQTFTTMGVGIYLPEDPTAAEMGEMNKVLMQKVEELTLHVIELQKQIDELKKGTSHE